MQDASSHSEVKPRSKELGSKPEEEVTSASDKPETIPETQAVSAAAPPAKKALSPRSWEARDLEETSSAEGVEISSHSQSSSTSRDGGRLESRIRGLERKT